MEAGEGGGPDCLLETLEESPARAQEPAPPPPSPTLAVLLALGLPKAQPWVPRPCTTLPPLPRLSLPPPPAQGLPTAHNL